MCWAALWVNRRTAMRLPRFRVGQYPISSTIQAASSSANHAGSVITNHSPKKTSTSSATEAPQLSESLAVVWITARALTLAACLLAAMPAPASPATA